MKKQLHIIIIMLMLGFLLPTSTYACGTKIEKNYCKKETAEKTEKNDCCNGKHSKNKNNSCGGKCGHSNCTTSTVNFSLISFYEIEFKSKPFGFYSEKSKFYHLKTFISSGFTFVWLPPKIR